MKSKDLSTKVSSGSGDTSLAMQQVLAAGGETGRLIGSMDWAHSSIGPLERWPQSLNTALSICLHSRFPIVIFWGPELALLYNDAYLPIPGDKHPGSMGQAGRECWQEIWDVIGPMLEGVMTTGAATWSDDQLLFVERKGYPEEGYFTFSYGPIRDETGVAGVFCAVSETTGSVLATRRLATLRQLAVSPAQSKTAEDACAAGATVLGENLADVPVALVYLLSPDNRVARLEGVAGISPGTESSPSEIELSTPGMAWPLREVVDTGAPVTVGSLALPMPAGALDGPEAEIETALILPLVDSKQQVVGTLVAGVSPYRDLDEEYRSFFELAAGHISAAIVDARAYEAERARAEALAELDRAKTAFFSNVSHEFRTPLTLLLAPIEDTLANGEGMSSTEQRERLETVHRNALRLLKLVNTLLDFSRVEADRAEAVYEPTDIASLTADLASVFRSAIERAGLQLVVDCPSIGEPTFVDREMWETIVFNLLSNAFKFTFEGEIAVRTERSGDSAALTVSDTGAGIAVEEIPRLFERFHRPRVTEARTYEGTGIGLSLVDQLVRLHGGSIEVSSELGRGATFSVRIPLGAEHLDPAEVRSAGTAPPTASSATPFVEEMLSWLPRDDRAVGASGTSQEGELARGGEPEPAEISGPANGARVLVVDDNADMREYLLRLLGRHWLVEGVADGDSALTSARERPPDVVLTDVMMPGLDGFGLLRELRADPKTAQIPIVMLSARAGEEAAVEGLDAGADDYLVKPFSAREAVARVRANLEMGRMRHESARIEAAEEIASFRQDLIAGMSHDMQTPLTAIVAFAETLAERPEISDHDAQTAYAVIRRQSRSLQTMVQQFLDFSRLEGDQPLLVRSKPVDVAEAVRSAADQFAHTDRVTVQVPEDLPAALADANRLAQVLRNLLSNALKFSAPGSLVKVMVNCDEKQVEIEVIDRGPGMSSDEVAHVFEKFHRGSAHDDKPGSGLGLYVSKALTEELGGSLTAVSWPGDGSRFTVTLPLAPSEWASEAVRVLVADDDVDTRLAVSTHLRSRGWKVDVVSSGQEALEHCRRSPVDVVVLDQKMPDLTGIETARQLRSRRFGQPISIFSAYLDPDVEAQAEGLGLVTLAKGNVKELGEIIASLDRGNGPDSPRMH